MKYHLQQSTSDTQVWMTREIDNKTTLHGLILVYVDDLLILSPKFPCRQRLKEALHGIWTMSVELELSPGVPLTFIWA